MPRPRRAARQAAAVVERVRLQRTLGSRAPTAIPPAAPSDPEAAGGNHSSSSGSGAVFASAATGATAPADFASLMAQLSTTTAGARAASGFLATAAAHPAATLRWAQFLQAHLGLSGPELVKSLARFPNFWLRDPEPWAPEVPLKLTWLQQELRMSRSDAVATLAALPMLLVLPLGAQLSSVVTFLRDEAGLDPVQVAKAAQRLPALLAASVPRSLRPRLAWLRRHDVSGSAAAGLIARAPRVLLLSEQTLAARLAGTAACLGVAEGQVLAMWRAEPSMMCRDVEGPVCQLKLRYLREIMGRDVSEVLACPHFLLFSLSEAIGPRYAFLERYCPAHAEAMALSTMVVTSWTVLLKRLKSEGLDRAAAAVGAGGREAVFRRFKAEWQADPANREWVQQRVSASHRARVARA